MADAGAGRDHATMQKIELRRHRTAIEQRRESHAAGTAVHRRRHSECSRVGVDDAFRQAGRLSRDRRRRPECSEGSAEQGGTQKRSSTFHGDPPARQFIPSG
jgi:hypothetical protein